MLDIVVKAAALGNLEDAVVDAISACKGNDTFSAQQQVQQALEADLPYWQGILTILE